ncbi:J domain-containing protein [Actinokineospora pegani]|uniref:J domain-containing protein n=1 Tax=Actinokineospora pegani TaxID=2654637 RepID=UPI0012EA6F60|nr:J domain-containing protein [Actinokineospora pegani]
MITRVDDVDYYELLGVRRDAGRAEVRSAFRALAKVLHPDAGGTAGTFRLLKTAYETLSDPARRAEYDRGGNTPAVPDPRPPARARGAARPRPRTRHDPGFVPPRCTVPPASLPWWHLTRHQAVIGPSDGPGHAPGAATVLGALLLASPLLAVGSMSPVVLLGWLALVAAVALTALRLGRAYLRAARARAAALAEFGDRAEFGVPDTEPVAERLTAELIARYPGRLPGAKVFHGLSRPDSVFADVDHAILCGHRLVLVESKLWLPGHYELDDDGALWRNGHPFRGGQTSLAETVATFAEMLPGVEVRGALLVYPSSDAELTVDETPVGGVHPLLAEGFVRGMGGWLAEGCGVMDPHTLRVLRDRVSRAAAV